LIKGKPESIKAEAKGLRRIFTLDSDFRIYRINGKGSFELFLLDCVVMKRTDIYEA